MSAGRSPGPTWTTLREPTDASSVMRSSDDDGDDELEVEKELTDPPLQKRKAQYSPSTALRVNKFPRLGLSGSSNTGRWVQGIASDDSEDAGGSTGPRPSVNVSCTLSTCAIDKSTSTKSTFTGGSSSDEFGGTLSQVIRQANTKERLDERKKNMDVEVQRDPRRDVPAPTTRVVARKQVNGRPRVSTGSLLQGVQRSNDPDSPARTRVRPKRKAAVVNRNALLAHFRPLDTPRRRSNAEVIELTDSDGERGPHGTGAVLGNSTTISKGSEDLIVISSGSDGNSPRSPTRLRRRSTPTFRSAKKSHSTVPRRASDFITILDSDDDSPVAALSVTHEHRRPTVTAPSVSTTIIGTQQEGSSELRSISVPELGNGFTVDDEAAIPDPDGAMPGYDMDVGSCRASSASPEPSPPRTCSPPTSPSRPDIDNTLDRAFGDIDLDLGGGDDGVADADPNINVDERNSATEACKERRGASGGQVNADVASEEYSGNKDDRESLQSSPGSKTIVCSSINSSNKVETASRDALIPLQSSTQAQSSKLSQNTAIGQMPGTTPGQAQKVPPTSKEIVLPNVSSYLVRFNRPESSQTSFFSRALGPSTSIQTAYMPLIAKKSTSVEVQMPKPDRAVLLSVTGLPTEPAKEHPDAEDSSQTSASAPAAHSEPFAQNTSGPLTSEVNVFTTTQEVEIPLSVGLALSPRQCDLPQARRMLPSRPSGSESSFLPFRERCPSPSVQPSVQSPQPSSRSTSATPAMQSHSTPCPRIPPPCRPPPLSKASLVDTLNQVRRDHLQAKVTRQKSKEPAVQSERRLEKTTSQPLASDGVDPPSTPSQFQTSREPRPRRQSPRVSGESPSLTRLRPLLHDKRLPKPGSKPSLTEAMAHPASRSRSELSSSTRSAAMEPSLHVPVDVPGLSTTTTPSSASIAKPHSMSPVFARRVPVSFEELISKSPATQRSLLTPMRPDGPSPSHNSPRRSISVPFEKFIVKTPRGRNGAPPPGESTPSAPPSSAAPVASMPPSIQLHDVPIEATMECQWPQRDGSQNNCITVDQTDHPHGGIDADRLLELADIYLETGEPEAHPLVQGYPEPVGESGMLTTDVEMAVGAETGHAGQTLPAGESDSVAAPGDTLVLDHQTSAMTPGRGHTSTAPVDIRETVSEDNYLLVSSRTTPPPDAVSRHSLRRRSSHHRSLSRSRSSVEPPPLDFFSTADAVKQLDKPLPLGVAEYIGGYPVITWQSFTASQRLLSSIYNRAKDLPHGLQDRMNALPKSYRNSEFGRMVFEEMILEAMDDEPYAPPIKIYENGIGEETTPPWEFVYTNKMWFGEGVPPPDVRNLVSCGCPGKCDPKSKTCACAKRQLQWLEPYIRDGLFPATWPGSPFLYDSRGILQREGCPIFECNQFCDCDDDCPNRVVQNGRIWPVNIVRTERKGWGVFAGPKKIPRGSYVGIYTGELLTEQEGEARGLLYNVFGRTYLFSIDFHHLKLGLKNENDYENLYAVDAYHAGNFTRFLNHSCDPNCEITACYINDADINKPLLAVFTIRDVEPWEELCFSYYGDTEAKRESLAEQQANGKLIARNDAVYVECSCGSTNCIGKLF